MTQENEKEIVLRVSGGSSHKALAGAIVKNWEEGKSISVTSIGAGALNQAVKGVAIARGYMASRGKDLMCRPGFLEVMIEEEKRTAIVLNLVVQ